MCMLDQKLVVDVVLSGISLEAATREGGILLAPAAARQCPVFQIKKKKRSLFRPWICTNGCAQKAAHLIKLTKLTHVRTPTEARILAQNFPQNSFIAAGPLLFFEKQVLPVQLCYPGRELALAAHDHPCPWTNFRWGCHCPAAREKPMINRVFGMLSHFSCRIQAQLPSAALTA